MNINSVSLKDEDGIYFRSAKYNSAHPRMTDLSGLFKSNSVGQNPQPRKNLNLIFKSK